MAGLRRRCAKTGLIWGAIALSALLAPACGNSSPDRQADLKVGNDNRREAPASGKAISVSVRTEPLAFNPLTRRDATSYLVSLLAHARLVRVNAATQQVEPFLAERWTSFDNGLRWRLTLRAGLAFADGTPVTPEAVVFSLAAAYDPSSVVADALLVGGRKLTATPVDASTVDITFPSAFGPGLRLLDMLPILPPHKLAAAVSAGRFEQAWGVSTPPGDMTGLGPFVISTYLPGERIEFVRNPHYFRRDAAGRQLPYLDRLTIAIVADQNAQVLALESGKSDTAMSEIRPEDMAPLRRGVDSGAVQVIDLGVAMDPDAFWMNLRPGAFANDPRVSWIQRDELRRAISLAVNRQTFADSVFLGAAVPVHGPITPANKTWYSDQVPRTPYNQAEARRLLEAIGLTDPDGDGQLADHAGRPARFTLLTAQGQTALERGAGFIRDELAKVGLGVDVVPLDANQLIQRFLAAKDYDAAYFHLTTTDPDPAMSADFWLSRGSAHVWNFGPNARPMAWEQEIDRLMAGNMAVQDQAERQRLFPEVQKIFAEHLPMLHFAAPRVYVAASSRLTNLTPAITRPQLLWAADTIDVR